VSFLIFNKKEDLQIQWVLSFVEKTYIEQNRSCWTLSRIRLETHPHKIQTFWGNSSTLKMRRNSISFDHWNDLSQLKEQLRISWSSVQIEMKEREREGEGCCHILSEGQSLRMGVSHQTSELPPVLMPTHPLWRHTFLLE
jgi:hypothetical protein